MGLFTNIFSHNKSKVIYPRKGFDFNYVMDEYSSIRKKKYNALTVQRHIEILKDCGNLINTTKKPNVFFSRYLIALALLNDLILIENKKVFNGDKPSEIKKQFYEKEIYTVNDFIDRYYEDIISQISGLKTQKAKQNRINDFCNGLNDYKQYLSTESLNKYNLLCVNLKNKI